MILHSPTDETWRDNLSLLPHAEHRIGGTDAAAILGLSPYRSPWDLWRIAHGGATPEHIDNALLARGRIVEPALLGWYAAKIGVDSGSIPAVVACNSDAPWMVGTLDGYIADDRRVVEWKTDLHRDDRWPPDGSTVSSPDEIPADYWVQICWYMAITSATEADVVVADRTRGRWDPVIDTAAAVALSTDHSIAEELIRRWYAVQIASRPVAPTTIRLVHVRPSPDDVAAIVDAVADARERMLVRGEEPPVDASAGCRQALVDRSRPSTRLRATDAQEALLRRALLT